MFSSNINFEQFDKKTRLELPPNVFSEISITRTETDAEIFQKVYDHLHGKVPFFMSLNELYEKSRERSTYYCVKGNDLLSEKYYVDALFFYNRSICEAPRESVEFGVAIANRSQALFLLRKYKDCLTDIHTLLRTDFPDSLKYKVYIRQTKCFLELKMYTKARKAIAEAEHFLTSKEFSPDKETQDRISAAEEIKLLKIKLNDISEQDAIVSFEDNVVLPKLTNGENSNYASASKLLAIHFDSRNIGHVTARADINEGAVLFIEKPYGHIALNTVKQLFMYCHYCFKTSYSYISCVLCSDIYYCSDKCRQICWNSYHRWECMGVRLNILPADLILALRILFRATHTGFQRNVPTSSKYGDKNDNYPYVHNLGVPELPIPLIQNNVLLAFMGLQYLIHYTDYFNFLYPQVQRPEGTMDELYRLIGGILFRHINQLNRGEKILNAHFNENSENLTENLNLNFENTGFGVYVSSLHIRHSCVPNAIVSFNGHVKIVRATKFIEKGAEVIVEVISKEYLYSCYEFKERLLISMIDKGCVNCIMCIRRDIQLPRYQSWLCPKCGGKAISNLKNNRIGKCVECKCICYLKDYRLIESRLATLASSEPTKNNFDIIYESMKKIYYKDNMKFFDVYRFYMVYYRENGEYVKSVKYAKILLQLLYNLGDTHDLYISTMYHLTLSLIEYSVGLKLLKSHKFKKVYEETLEFIKSVSALLKFRANNETVNIIIGKLHAFLESKIDESKRPVLEQQ